MALITDSLSPPTPQDWHHKIVVNDFVARDLTAQAGMWVYQEVTGMTSSKKTCRQVRGYSVCCQNGELGDTYLSGMVAFIDPKLWFLLRDLGWPADLKALRAAVDGQDVDIYCEMADRDGVLCPTLCIKGSGITPKPKFG
jgi:hypothetical protein